MCNSCIKNSKQWTSEEAMAMHIPNALCDSVVSCLEAQLYTEVASWDKMATLQFIYTYIVYH